MNIILIGFMGTGKSSVARMLGRMTGWECRDVDDWIIEKAGKSIPAIFEEEGEDGFRNRESEALRELLTGENAIVSGGGGIVLRKENVEAMKAGGTTVCLTASPETIFQRVGTDRNRPNLDGRRSPAGIGELLNHREPAYRAAADLCVATDGKSVREVAREILDRLGVRYDE
jgi:shikimate kinase